MVLVVRYDATLDWTVTNYWNVFRNFYLWYNFVSYGEITESLKFHLTVTKDYGIIIGNEN